MTRTLKAAVIGRECGGAMNTDLRRRPWPEHAGPRRSRDGVAIVVFNPALAHGSLTRPHRVVTYAAVCPPPLKGVALVPAPDPWRDRRSGAGRRDGPAGPRSRRYRRERRRGLLQHRHERLPGNSDRPL